MATAGDPFIAAQRIHEEVPNVIVLDVEMPRMDGITFLRKIMAQRPIPTVLCSTLLEAGSETLLEALDAGAVDVILKPRVDTKQFLNESQVRIWDSIRALGMNDDLDAGILGAHLVHVAGQKALMDGAMALPQQNAAGRQTAPWSGRPASAHGSHTAISSSGMPIA